MGTNRRKGVHAGLRCQERQAVGRASSLFPNPSFPYCVPGPILAGAEKHIPAPHQEPWQTTSQGVYGAQKEESSLLNSNEPHPPRVWSDMGT